MFNSFLLEYEKLENRWDIKWYIWMLDSVFPMEKLWKYIKERSEKIKLNNSPNEVFSILWVNNKVWVIDTYDELWKNINQSYKKVKTNDITYNPYRVNVWSIWIVKQWLKWKYISPAYVVFHCDEKYLSTEYLHLILSSNWFNNTLRANTSWSVRQNLTFDLLSSLEIPLPPLEIQEKIVKTYNDIKNEIERLEDENKNLNKEVDNYLMKELGIEIEEKEKKKFFCVGYEDLERWDVLSFLWNLYKSKFEELKMKDIAHSIHRWKSPKYDDNWKYIAVSQKCVWNISFDLSRSRNWDTENAQKIDKKLLVSKDDILINSTWEWTIWRVCIIDKDYENCITDSHVTTLRVNNNIVLPIFVTYYFNTIHWQTKLSDCFSWWTKQKELTKWKFELISFPIPTLNIQEKIVNWIDEIKNKNKLNQDRIEKLKVDLDEKIKGMILEGKFL